MNTQRPYDPEDMEALMLNKSFDELLPDERTFVLQHLSGEQEYESMRQLLFLSMESMQESKPQPPGALKERVMHDFREHRQTQTQRYIWLNFMTQVWVAFKSRPVMQIATACAVLIFVVVLWNPFQGDSKLAESIVKEQKDKSEAAKKMENKSAEKPAAKLENEINQDLETETKTSSTEISPTPPLPESPMEEFVAVEEDFTEIEDSNYSAVNVAPVAASDQFEDALTDSEQNAKPAANDEAVETTIEQTQVELVDDALLSVLFTAR